MGAKWGMPAFGILMGAVLLGACAIGGQPALGLGMFAVMAVYSGILVAFGGRSDVVGVLRGQPIDERLAGFNGAATAVAGFVAIVVALGGFLWQIAHGEDGLELAMVAASGGLAYLAALGWFHWRR